MAGKLVDFLIRRISTGSHRACFIGISNGVPCSAVGDLHLSALQVITKWCGEGDRSAAGAWLWLWRRHDAKPSGWNGNEPDTLELGSLEAAASVLLDRKGYCLVQICSELDR